MSLHRHLVGTLIILSPTLALRNHTISCHSHLHDLTPFLLRNGTVLSAVKWTPEELEKWITSSCWPMGYQFWDSAKRQQMRDRIVDAIKMLKWWSKAVGVSSHKSKERGRDRESRDKEKRKDREQQNQSTWSGSHMITAHNAMGGGEVVGGNAESAASNGWTSSFGAFPPPPIPGLVQQGQMPGLRSPPPFGAGSISMPMPPTMPPTMPIPVPTPNPTYMPNIVKPMSPVNVRDWGSDASPSGSCSGSGSDREKDRRRKEKSRQRSLVMTMEESRDMVKSPIFIPTYEEEARQRSLSRSRARSQSRLRNSQEEIFIPPAIEEEVHPYGGNGAGLDGGVYSHPPRYQIHTNPEPQSTPQPPPYAQTQLRRQTHPQWIHINPNHAPVASRDPSPDPYHGIYAPNPGADHRGSHSHLSQSYAPDLTDHHALADSVQMPQGQRGHGGSRWHPHNHPPMTSSPTAQSSKEKSRKKKDKRRTKEIERARVSKWAPRALMKFTGAGKNSSETDSDTEEDEDDEDDTVGGRNGWRTGRDGSREMESMMRTRGDEELVGQRQPADGSPWHNIYANSGQAAGAVSAQQQQQQQLHAPWMPPSGGRESDHERGRSMSNLQAPSRPGSRNPGSRNPSPNPTSKRRPAPLNLTPPLAIPANLPAAPSHAVENQPHRHQHSNSQSRPDDLASLEPAQLAQYQFEQQQKQYQLQLHFQRQQQQEQQQVQAQERQQHQQYHQQQQQQPERQYGQPLRAAATWISGGHSQHPQQYYYQQQQQQQQQQQHRPQALRPSMSDIYQ